MVLSGATLVYVDTETSLESLDFAYLSISKTDKSHGMQSLPQWTTMTAPVLRAVASCSSIILRKKSLSPVMSA